MVTPASLSRGGAAHRSRELFHSMDGPCAPPGSEVRSVVENIRVGALRCDQKFGCRCMELLRACGGSARDLGYPIFAS